MKLKDNILANIEKLPENLQVEILHYSEYLLNNYTLKNEETLYKKQQPNKLLEEKSISMSSQKDDDKPHGYGSWAGDIIMSDDFDEMSPKKEDDQLYGYGSLAGKIIMSEDFDEPLEDLAEYM